MKLILTSLIAALALLAGCTRNGDAVSATGEATPATLQANARFAQELKLDDQQDFQDAQRGLIAKPSGKIVAADGTLLKDFDAYGFLVGKPADTVNPSLWRHAQLNAHAGLFKVTEGVYQLRGFDMANMTLIEGRTGWIVVDTLTARESAAAALAFARQHLGNKPVSAVIFTHAHADHFGGALGVITPQEIAERKVRVIAPAGFLEAATSENVLVGARMLRRSIYQFGRALPRSVKGNVDNGLGNDLV